jgi:hypothetical protein
MYMVRLFVTIPKPMSNIETSVSPSNTVVFNLWSACLETRREAPPLFNNWTTLCQTNMVIVTNNDYPLHDGAKGADIPEWAYISPSADSSFDLGMAMESEPILVYITAKAA